MLEVLLLYHSHSPIVTIESIILRFGQTLQEQHALQHRAHRDTLQNECFQEGKVAPHSFSFTVVVAVETSPHHISLFLQLLKSAMLLLYCLQSLVFPHQSLL